MGESNSARRILRLILLGLLMLLAVVLVRYPYESKGRLPVTDTLLQSITFPFQKLQIYLQKKWDVLSDHFSDLNTLRQENSELKTQLAEYTERAQLAEKALREVAYMSDALQLNFYERGRYRIGTVISRSLSNWYRTLFINIGASSNVDLNDTVLTGVGLVGRIVEAGYTRSKVLLLTDPTCAVSAMVRRTKDHGIVYGLGEGERMEMRFLNTDAKIQEGDIVETSGLGEVYARGIPIGRAIGVSKDKNYSTVRVLVQPFVDFSHIEKVIVIKERP